MMSFQSIRDDHHRHATKGYPTENSKKPKGQLKISLFSSSSSSSMTQAFLSSFVFGTRGWCLCSGTETAKICDAFFKRYFESLTLTFHRCVIIIICVQALKGFYVAELFNKCSSSTLRLPIQAIICYKVTRVTHEKTICLT